MRLLKQGLLIGILILMMPLFFLPDSSSAGCSGDCMYTGCSAAGAEAGTNLICEGGTVTTCWEGEIDPPDPILQ